MSEVCSKSWSTSTLDAGIAHVSGEAELAQLEQEEVRLLLEMQEILLVVQTLKHDCILLV